MQVNGRDLRAREVRRRYLRVRRACAEYSLVNVSPEQCPLPPLEKDLVNPTNLVDLAAHYQIVSIRSRSIASTTNDLWSSINYRFFARVVDERE